MRTSVKEIQRSELESKIADLMSQTRDQQALKIESAADPFDQIQASTERDLLVGLLNRDAKMREDLRRAVERMDEGGYGICEDCEEPIAALRLKAIPWARCCLRCQAIRDRQVNEADVFPERAA